MKTKIAYPEAQDLVLEAVRPVGTETVALETAHLRVLASALTAAGDVPAFDRSPYDGYAFRAADTGDASPDHPVTLRILEEIAAGQTSHVPVIAGTAVRIMTGAPVPAGADAICKFEDTKFTETEVTLFSPSKPGENIIRAGEDVRKGSLLAGPGSLIDTGLLGLLAAQNCIRPAVYRVPKVGILSTGSELIEPGEPLPEGRIYNTNRFTIAAAIRDCGCAPDYLGIVGDEPALLADAITRAVKACDALVLTGGVSVGKYDYTLQAMEMAGAEVLFNGVKMKPGMACVYGVLNGKLLAGLSGNPASSLTNFHTLTAPALRKLTGNTAYRPEFFPLVLKDRFPKKSPGTRFLRGRLDLSDGIAGIRISEDQGNIVLRSTVGTDVMALVPAGSGPQEAGTVLQGFLL